MYKDLFFKLISMPFTRDALNCVLRYTLAQPVEMDFMIVLMLITEYTGLSGLFCRLFDNNNEEVRADEQVEEFLQTS